MTSICNIKYDVTQRERLEKQLSFAWDIYNKFKKADLIKQSIKKNFGPEHNQQISLKGLSSKEALDFYSDVNAIVYNLSGVTADQQLPATYEDFRQVVLSTFFDINTEEKPQIKKQEEEKAETEEEIDQRTLLELDIAIEDVYGNPNILLGQNVQDKIYKDLQKLLIVDVTTVTKHNINDQQVNSRIAKYKEEKFLKILDFLKRTQTGDSRLQQIKSMYSNNVLNISDYFYVLNAFNSYIKSFNNLNKILTDEFFEELDQTTRLSQEQQYNNLIALLKTDQDFLEWFNGHFNTTAKQDNASQLFTGESFSRAYNEIKEIIEEFQGDFSDSLNDNIKDIINSIENPKETMLSYVDDYFILSQFDNLVNYKLRDRIRINDGYTVGAEPMSKITGKYSLYDSHKHQKSGWETGNDESSEKSTSATVKDILDSLYLYEYKGSHKLIPTKLSLPLINSAWHSLIYDLLNNGAKFNSERDEKLRNLIYYTQDDTLGNILDIFKMLFDGSYRLIDRIENTNLFNENHKNILYSFYKHVLDPNNPNSFLFKETENLNESFSNFLELTTDLVAILHRTVTNTYLDCNHRSNTLSTISKYNWDSNLFDQVERMSVNNMTYQKTPQVSESKLNNFESNNSQAYLTFTDSEGNARLLGYDYGNTSRKIFTLENKLNIIDREYLDTLANIDLEEFYRNYTNENLSIDENNLKDFFELMSHYLDIKVLSAEGIETLNYYKKEYKANKKDRLYSSNYLDNFLRLVLQAMEAHKQALQANRAGKTIKEYLEGVEEYSALYKSEMEKDSDSLFDNLGNEIYFKIGSSKNQALINYIKASMQIKGESMKSTILNRQGATVSNYTVARAGSRLYQRLYRQKLQSGKPSQSLLFVKHTSSLDPDPVVDQEIITATGDVVTVRDLTENELFKHSIIDKFYNSYIENDKICFQPTVYSDKIQFLNYFTKIDFLGNNVMNLTNNITDIIVNQYKETFFAAHANIQEQIFNKLERLISFQGYTAIATKRADIINEFLKSHNENSLGQLIQKYNKANPNNIIEVELDKDYRIFNGHLTLNEIVNEYADLFNEGNTAIAKHLQEQLNLFIDDLHYYGTSFKLFDDASELKSWLNAKIEDGEIVEELPRFKMKGILNVLSNSKILALKDRKAYANKWINNSGELIINIDNEVNPLLEKFFYLEGLLSNNLRLSLTGSEINHPDKSDNLFRNIVKANKDYLDNNDIATLRDVLVKNKIFNSSVLDDTIIAFSNAFTNKSISELQFLSPDSDFYKELTYIYKNSIQDIINVAQGTQFKRNVIVPATLQNPLLGLINGMSNTVKVAVIRDMKAPVNNLRYSDEIDSQDGSAKMSYIQMKLENNGLGDQKVGTNRKPIWDDQTSELSSFLAKFAAFAIDNNEMRQSTGSVSSQFNLFKKMHNLQWEEGTIDLTKSIYDSEQFQMSETSVTNWFKQRILEGKRLFYKNQYDQTIEIIGFGKDASGYYTTEKMKGLEDSTAQKVYHYYDGMSNHYTEMPEGGHTINSLFELFIAMGGTECVDIDGNASNFSLDVLTNFVINVGYKKVVGKVSLAKDVVQPLKSQFIAYALNNTAVKNGAKNINASKRWTDGEKLNYFNVYTGGLGIQLNADHDVINSEMTEFSQVIAACAAYGKKFEMTDDLFFGLAQSAMESSSEELDNIKNYLQQVTKDPLKAKYDLYRIIAKLMIKSNSNSEYDLTNQVKQEVNIILQENKSNAGDNDMKLPFSDPSLYKQFITSITSVINKKSIKRKHPGAAYVMVPAYNVVQYYQYRDRSTNQYRKYMFQDIVRMAKKDYKDLLHTYLKKVAPDKYKKNASFRDLIELAKTELTEEQIPYLAINSNDLVNYNKELVRIYLNAKQEKEPTRDQEWFMPTDIVLIKHLDGTEESLDLSDMKDYYNFKNTVYQEGTIFKIDVRKPNNLKPSLIRWQYEIDIITGQPPTSESLPENIKTKYMTIYDHPIIRSSWHLPKELKPKQAEIQEVLDLLDEGIFKIGENEFTVKPGTLENTEAELVLGNMYQKVFDTQNKSLAQILDEGPEFFKQQAKDEIQDLPTGHYHLALMRSDGKHALISLDKTLPEGFRQYKEDQQYVMANPFKNEYVNNAHEIYSKKNGFKIGKYVPSNWEFKDGKVITDKGTVADKSEYMLDYDNDKKNVVKVLRRVDFIKRYAQQNSSSINGKTQVYRYDLYQISSIDEIAKAFDIDFDNRTKEEQSVLRRQASNQIAKIINDLYKQNKYSDARLNLGKLKGGNLEVRQQLSNFLLELGNYHIKEDSGYREMTEQEISQLPRFQKYMITVRKQLLQNDFYQKYNSIYENYFSGLKTHYERYASFLNSLYFISSRIPAQSLQSFMPMKCVGWTGDSNNTAYVSYIQTFLQGSDYDIDKAYIMGQSFDDGIYIGWSNFFDNSTLETLQASKTLPIPRELGYKFSIGENFNIDKDLEIIINTKNKAEKIKLIGSLIRKINSNKGNYNYNKSDVTKAALVKKLRQHDTYKPKQELREQAYKNASSANIFNIVHDIRNRDQAYSDITMRDFRKAADNSPKGKRTKKLNMLNPLTKYIMQRQNLVGKDVIGIAANGEKDWFNITYQYHKILREGTLKDQDYLLLSRSYSRINGRASKDLRLKEVKHIPDLWHANAELTKKLKRQFYNQNLVTEESDKYVDQLISQLLSAATDNAKELILAKINAGTNLAKYHLHLMMMGFSLDDIVAFMTSPVIELIDKYSKSDIFANQTSNVDKAIKILEGDINLDELLIEPSRFLYGEALQNYQEGKRDLSQEEGLDEYYWIMSNIEKAYTKIKARNVSDFFKKYMRIKLELSYLNDAQINKLDDSEIYKFFKNYQLPTDTASYNTNHAFKHINNTISNIQEEIKNYKKDVLPDYTIENFFDDLNEFKQLTEEANETSTLASVWLKLNQGIPQVDEDLISLVKKMKDSIKTRENKFGINKLIRTRKKFSLLEEFESEDIKEEKKEESESDKKKSKKDIYLDTLKSWDGTKFLEENKSLEKVINNIISNNSALNKTYVVNVLKRSIENDIYGNFDLYKFLADERIDIKNGESFSSYHDGTVSYRELAADYYNLIKASWNILDIVTRVPTYKTNLDLLNYTLQSRQLFPNKATIIEEFLENPKLRTRNLSKKEYKRLTQFADKIIISSFFFQIDKPIDLSIIPHAEIFNDKYDVIKSSILNINTLTGIDSLKYFVENTLVQWLRNQEKYKDNVLVQDLTQSRYFGKTIVRTTLDLSKINNSLLNKQTYNKYLLGFAELCKDKIFGEYSVGDILSLYNLAVNGTKIGGRFLTAIFKNSVIPGSIIHDYYKTISNSDYNSDYTYLMPTSRDLLIAMAPTISSKDGLSALTDPYVKVLNQLRGFDVYKRVGKRYVRVPEELISIEDNGVIDPKVENKRLFNYSNSLTFFPQLHRRMIEGSIFNNVQIETAIDNMVDTLSRYISEYRLLIYKNC